MHLQLHLPFGREVDSPPCAIAKSSRYLSSTCFCFCKTACIRIRVPRGVIGVQQQLALDQNSTVLILPRSILRNSLDS